MTPYDDKHPLIDTILDFRFHHPATDVRTLTKRLRTASEGGGDEDGLRGDFERWEMGLKRLRVACDAKAREEVVLIAQAEELSRKIEHERHLLVQESSKAQERKRRLDRQRKCEELVKGLRGREKSKSELDSLIESLTTTLQTQTHLSTSYLQESTSRRTSLALLSTSLSTLLTQTRPEDRSPSTKRPSPPTTAGEGSRGRDVLDPKAPPYQPKNFPPPTGPSQGGTGQKHALPMRPGQVGFVPPPVGGLMAAPVVRRERERGVRGGEEAGEKGKRTLGESYSGSGKVSTVSGGRESEDGEVEDGEVRGKGGKRGRKDGEAEGEGAEAEGKVVPGKGKRRKVDDSVEEGETRRTTRGSKRG